MWVRQIFGSAITAGALTHNPLLLLNVPNDVATTYGIANISDDTSTQDEEPINNNDTAVIEKQEPTLYAGKYKFVDLFLYENCTVHNIINLFLIDI